MARFKFALQAVLDSRVHAEREKQRQLAEIERERLALEDRLRSVQGHLASGKREVREALSAGVVSISTVRLQAQAGIGWEAEARRVVVELAALHRRLERARQELLEATTARRSLELLRDRRHAEWQRSRRLAEDRVLDELATMRSVRRDA